MTTELEPVAARPETSGAPPSLHRFSVDEYHQLVDAGVLTADDRVQLLDGVIFDMSPMGSRHVVATRLCDQALTANLGTGFHCRVQAPLSLATSEPEPDVCVVRGELRDYADRHPVPADVLLTIEVSDATLELDQVRKHALYARAGVPVYWIVDLQNDRIEVLSDPRSDEPEVPAHYASRTVVDRAGTVDLVLDGRLAAVLPVRDLLP